MSMEHIQQLERERDALRQRVEGLEAGLDSAIHYMRNCGVNIERDFPEIATLNRTGGGGTGPY
jgi:hypothetical protein